MPKADALLLEERTRDLQRLQAEYANYRKRAERDRLAAGDAAIARLAGEFLPVLDDLDRARAHGDLTGALKAVADKLDDVFAKLGLESFGAVGDPFDPSIHEAVMHDVSDDVSVPTATTVMRVGYRHRDRLVRPAMVGVSDPGSPSGEAAVEDAAPDLAGDVDTLTDSTADGHRARRRALTRLTRQPRTTPARKEVTHDDEYEGLHREGLLQVARRRQGRVRRRDQEGLPQAGA